MSPLPPLPHRPDQAHKGTFGHVLLIAGGVGMSGAAALAGMGALRGGAGLVSLAVPRSILPVIATFDPSYLTIPLPDDAQGRLTVDSLEAIDAALEGKDAAGLGPGLGRSEGIGEIVQDLYRRLDIPLVVDADGLNVLSRDRESLSQHAGGRILTPHPGEFARLTGSDVGSVQAAREVRAQEFAAQHGIVLVLKGQGTVVTDGAQVAVNTTGNSGMASGGTGDVLTGLLTALLAQRMEPFDAARLGVYLHGLAGDLAAEELSKPGLIASDLPRFIAKAWLQAEREGLDEG